LNILFRLRGTIDEKAPPRKHVKLPKGQERGDDREPKYPYTFVSEKY